MNDLPTLPEAGGASAGAPNPAGAAEASRAAPPATLAHALQRPLTISVIVLAILLAANFWSSHTQIRNLRAEVARRLQKDDAINAETSALAKAVQERGRELQIKVALLESRQSEAQSQQLALEQLYQDLSKNRDEWALAEVEQVLSTASQQLQLSGNVAGALIALQNADHSLARSDKPQFITVRRAIARDIEKLKALPNVDLTGVALHLDAAIAQIDALPTLADEKPVLPAPPAKPAKPGKGGDRVAAKRPGGAPAPAPAPADSGDTWLRQLQSVWQDWSGEMWTDVRQLIRLRSVETPDALMLSPSQTYFLRENLKLRLLNARLALLSRNESAFRSDLSVAQDALAKYFDTRAKATQGTQALLRQVQAANLALDMPSLSDSLNAVRNFKAKS